MRKTNQLIWLALLMTPTFLACNIVRAETMQNTPGPKITLGVPVVVSRAPLGLREWGPWQFPSIQRLPDGRLQIAYHMAADSATAYGTPPGVAVSGDNGKTWTEMKPGDPAFSWAWDSAPALLVLPNGDLLRQVQLRSRKFQDVQEKLPPPFTTWTASYTMYLAEKMPKELAGYRFSRLKKGSREWVEETADVNIPGAVHTVAREDGNVLIFPCVWRIKIAPDGTLWGVDHNLRVVDGTLRTPLAISFLRSTDHGHTWNLLSEIPYQPDKEADSFWDKNEGFEEPNITFMPDGSVFCLIRTTEAKVEPLYTSRSTDNGKTWSKPVVFDNLGVWPALLTLKNGVTLASYGRPGLYIRATNDPAGRSWGSRVTVVNPGAWGKDTCSYSDLIALNDHSALIVYSDFKYPDEQGQPRKTILVRKVTVVAK
jgi:hypothetical protein